MNHASLFSGIGGFDLAAEWNGWNNVFNCEWEEFPRKVLKHHFPNAKQYEDIKDFNATEYRGRVDVLSGGFPCQPFSTLQENEKEQKMTATCGRRCLELSESVNPVGSWARTFAGLLVGRTDWFSKRVTLTWKLSGTPSNRLLFQLVPQAHPTDATEFGLLLKTPTVMDGEVTSGKKNPISGNSGTLAQEIMSEYNPTMMKLGMLPTPTTQEPTSDCEITESGRRKTKDGKGSHSLNLGRIAGMLLTPTTREEVMDMDKFKTRMEKYDNGTTVPNLATQIGGNAPDSKRIRLEHTKKSGSVEPCEGETRDIAEPIDTNGERGNVPTPTAVDARGAYRTGVYDKQKREIRQDRESCQIYISRPGWVQFENFPTVPPICGGDDGLPEELDGITFSKWRKESIKAYGNAIVPQVAHRIFQSISDYESSKQIHK
jgi:hypothetical protein